MFQGGKMNTQKIIKSTLLSLAMLVSTAASAEPQENSSQRLTRTSASGLALSTGLSKNFYTQESYQDTETYYVDIPYEDTETYTDYEDYTTSEYICHDETSYERQCQQVTECGRVFSAGQNLLSSTIKPMRERPPGVGPAPFPGDPNPSPNPFPEPTPRCDTHEVCQNVPVTHQECSYQTVTHSRPVTRTRTVTRYRQEARTREVTRYRDIFDHQVSLTVDVQFPQGSELAGDEQEIFDLELNGSDHSLNVDITPARSIFGYSVVSRQVIGAHATLVLALKPRFAQKDLKESTLKNLQMIPSAEGLSFQFSDTAIFPRVSSRYVVKILDKASGQVIAESAVKVVDQKSQSGQVPAALDASKDYLAVIEMHREGIVIENGAVDFKIQKSINLKIDVDSLKNDRLISAQIAGVGAEAQILLADKTTAFSGVVTKYVITLVRQGSFGKSVSMSAKAFARKDLNTNESGQAVISIKSFGLSASDLAKYIAHGQKLNVVIEVNRSLPDGSKIQFWKDNWQNL